MSGGPEKASPVMSTLPTLGKISRFAQLQGSLPCMSLAASERFEGDEVFWVRLRIVIRDKDLGRVNIVNC